MSAKTGHRLDYTKAHSRRRRGWIAKKAFEELYEKLPNGCWIWKGSFHVRGYPIFKGWEPARWTALWKAGSTATQETHTLGGGGTTCGNKKCIAPTHIIVLKRRKPRFQ